MEYVACNLCGSDDTELLYPDTLSKDSAKDGAEHLRCTSSSYGRHYAIVRCRNCGLVYANPRREEDAILKSYEEVVDNTYLEEREGRILTFRRRLDCLERLAPFAEARRLLDVGCYTGIFLELAQERGWEAWGVEPSRWAAEHGRRKGLRVIASTLEEASFPDDFFHVVTMWDVIEHLTNPLRTLRESNRILKGGGLICIHTMNIESPFAKLMGPHWPWLMEMHLYYFSPRTLEAMLKKAGFEVIRMVTQGRFVRLGYLLSRLEAYAPSLSRGLVRLVTTLGLKGLIVPINLGDLFTAYARKVKCAHR